MATTKKTDKIMAMRLEAGKTIGSAWAFGGSTVQSLGANTQVSYMEVDAKNEVVLIEDEAIEGAAIQDLPIQAEISADIPTLGGGLKYEGYDKLHYWLFGYEDGGSSPQSLGGGDYSHLYELDRHERHFAAYRTAEQTAGDYQATDRKNRFMTMAFKMGTNDFRYKHILCNSFTISGSAGEKLKWSTGANGYLEQRGDYDSGTWTIPTAAQGSSSTVMFHHITASIGTSGALSAIGIKDFNINVEIPLDVAQDSESGLNLKELLLNGFYTVNASFTITRHSVDTFLDYRDDFDALAMKIVASSGDFEYGLYMPNVKVKEASVNDDNVPGQPIELTVNDGAGLTPFSGDIGSHNLIQNAQLFVLIKNTNSVNEMRRE